MSATPFRGTLIFVGGIAAVAVTSAARFAGADVAAVPAAAGSPTSDSTTSAPAGSSDTPSAATTAPGADGSSGSSSAAADPAATPSAAPDTSSGTVTIVGSTVQTRFGPLQLSVTFDGSDVTDVQALQYPSWHGESVQINQYAVPILNQEAVAADSAQIDSVSGATITSEAYKESLQAAIDQRG